MERRCPSCAAPARRGARFCRKCGYPLAADIGPEEPGPPPLKPVQADAAPPPGPPRPHGRRHPERLWKQFLPALQLWVVLLAVNGICGLFAYVSESSLLGLDLIAMIVDGIVILLFVQLDGKHLMPLLRRTGFTRRNWWSSPAVLVVMAVFMGVYLQILSWLGLESDGCLEEYIDQGWPLWTAFVMISLCPGVLEELAFRGFIQGRLERIVSPREALFLQAAMFSVLHMNPLIFLSHFFIGYLFGLLRNRTRSLYPGILVHMAWNAWILIDEMWSAG